FFILGALFAVGILWAQRPGARNGSAHSAERLPLAILANAGKLSFGLYMIHPVSRFWMNSLFGRWHVPPSALAAVLFLTGWLAISWVLAYASYHLLEEPLLDRARSRVSAMIAGKASVFAKPQAAA